MVNRGVLETKSRVSWEVKVLRNVRIRKVIYKILPANSERRQKLQQTMNRAGIVDSVNSLQIRRLGLAVFLFIVSIISVGANVISNTTYIRNDIYTGLPRENFSQALLLYDDETDYYNFIDDTKAADKQTIKYLSDYDDNGITYYMLSESEQEQLIRSYFTSSGVGDLYRETNFRNYAVTRIMAKMKQLEKVTGLTNLLFVILITAVGYFIPLALIQIKAYMNKDLLLLDEVTDLQKTTLMLMEYSSTTPAGLLSWYASSTVLLSAELKECSVTNDFDAIINNTTYKPYIQLMTSLKMSFDGLPLKEAFSGVEQRLLTQKKEQNRIIERILKTRIEVVQMFTSISMGAVIGLYMFMPLLVAMIQMFMSLDIF
jgi:hypothetical protein